MVSVGEGFGNIIANDEDRGVLSQGRVYILFYGFVFLVIFLELIGTIKFVILVLSQVCTDDI